MTKIAILAVVIFGCGKESGKTEAPAKEPIAKSSVPVVEPINTAEARRRYAEQLTSGDVIARATGPDSTVLEIDSRSQGCALKNLGPIVSASRRAMADRGYTKLRCIGSDVEVPVVEVSPEPNVAPLAGAAVNVTAVDLAKAYKTDDVGADDKYRNRVLLVTGTLGAVRKDLIGMDDPLSVTFASSEGEVHANVGDAAKALERGQTVTLRCTGKGFLMETPMVGDCTIAK